MKKVTFTLLAVLFAVSSAFAEISLGEPHSTIIPRTGNRPEAGDFGLYLGASVTQIYDLVKLNQNEDFKDNSYWALPAINLKYYSSSNWEWRFGFQFACNAIKEKATKNNKSGVNYSASQNINYTRFLPGFAYHFTTENILDVYLGVQVPIGFDLSTKKSTFDYGETYYINNSKKNYFVIGAGVFFGLQVFVADLPFAIGMEVGYSGQGRIGKGHVTEYYDNAEESQVKAYNPALSDTQIDDIKSSSHMEGRWGADAAITFSYYFH